MPDINQHCRAADKSFSTSTLLADVDALVAILHNTSRLVMEAYRQGAKTVNARIILE